MISIPDTLVKYNYAELSYDQLASEIGFSTEELSMLNIFWEPTFNEGWIYLSDKIIKNDMGYTQISAFYRDTLRKKYKENIDFKEIKSNDDLVKIYESLNGDQLLLGKKKHTGGKIKKYYAVTGETFKKLLIRCGTSKSDQICDYYLKVEQLARFMKDYISALHKHILENKLEEKDKVIQEEKDKFHRIHIVNEEYLSYKKLKDKNETIYIVTTYNYAKQGIYKIGRTKNMKSRNAGHNTTHVVGDKVKILKEFRVNDSQLIEKVIHKKLNGLLVKGDAEFFMCPYDLLENLVDVIVNDDSSHNELVNSIIDTVNTLRVLSYDEARWMSGIDMNIFTEEMRLVITNADNGEDDIKAVFDVTIATEEQKKEFVSQCVVAYKQTIEEPQKIAWRQFTKYLFEQLPIPKYKYRSGDWKPLFIEAKNTPITEVSTNTLVVY